ncbi:MAG: tetratricopeptide repeat protein [Pseudomonadota bacterium]
MPKNKGKYHSRQEETPAPQEELVSLTARVIQFVRPHATKIGAVLAGVAAVLVLVSVRSWYVDRQAAKATAALGKAAEILRAPVATAAGSEESSPSLDELASGSTTKPGSENQPTKYGTSKERAEAAIAALESIRKDYGSAAPAAQAMLVQAGLFYDVQRYDEAISRYQEYLKTEPAGKLSFIALEGIGYAQEAKALAESDATARTAGLAVALSTFEKLQPDEQGYYRDYALFHQARIRAAQGDRQGALALYRQILEKHRPTPLAEEIDNRIAVLDEQSQSAAP